MIARIKLYLKWYNVPRQLTETILLMAALAIPIAGVAIAFYAQDVILKELSKATMLIGALLFLKVISQKNNQ